MNIAFLRKKLQKRTKDEISDFFLKIGPLLYLKGKLLPEIDPGIS